MKIDIATTKTVAKIVIGRSVSGVIVTALHNTVPTESKAQKAQLYIGAHVVGSMVADAATEYTNKKIDAIAEAVREFKNSKKTDQ